MQWTHMEPAVAARDLGTALSGLPLSEVISLARVLAVRPLVLMTNDVTRVVLRHVRKTREESGGLLLGHAAMPSQGKRSPLRPLVCITEAVPAEQAEGTGVSLRMESAVWTAALPKIQSGLLVVGWFHSHPNLGAFFSGTDRNTQRHFFSHDYSVGYVVDPVRNQHAFFLGAESEEIPDTDVVRVDAGEVASLTCRLLDRKPPET